MACDEDADTAMAPRIRPWHRGRDYDSGDESRRYRGGGHDFGPVTLIPDDGP